MAANPWRGLSPEIRGLVSRSVAVLGEVIHAELGGEDYRCVERVRQEMAALRNASSRSKDAVLGRWLGRFRAMSERRREGVTHSFTLMLELMNACENAYRTY